MIAKKTLPLRHSSDGRGYTLAAAVVGGATHSCGSGGAQADFHVVAEDNVRRGRRENCRGDATGTASARPAKASRSTAGALATRALREVAGVAAIARVACRDRRRGDAHAAADREDGDAGSTATAPMTPTAAAGARASTSPTA